MARMTSAPSRTYLLTKPPYSPLPFATISTNVRCSIVSISPSTKPSTRKASASKLSRPIPLYRIIGRRIPHATPTSLSTRGVCSNTRQSPFSTAKRPRFSPTVLTNGPSCLTSRCRVDACPSTELSSIRTHGPPSAVRCCSRTNGIPSQPSRSNQADAPPRTPRSNSTLASFDRALPLALGKTPITHSLPNFEAIAFEANEKTSPDAPSFERFGRRVGVPGWIQQRWSWSIIGDHQEGAHD
jgi:hypothetical protein